MTLPVSALSTAGRLLQVGARGALPPLRRISPTEVAFGTFIGVGGQAEVHHLLHAGTTEVYAAKLFRVPFRFKNFFSELRVARRISQMDSPYLARQRGYFIHSPDENLHHRRGVVVMEFLEGTSIALRSAKTLDEQRLLLPSTVDRYVDYLRGLKDLHSVGIVHRDIKPSNLWDPPAGPGKIIDFSISAPVNPRNQRVRPSTEVPGTPEYMPPESFYEMLCGSALDPRLAHYSFQADLFSIGASLHETITGNCLFSGIGSHNSVVRSYISQFGLPAFYAKRSPSVTMALTQQNPASAEQLLAFAGLDRIIGRATEFFPQDRYQTADEMLEALLQWKSSFGHLSFASNP